MNIGIITLSFLPSVGGLEWKVHYLATEYVKSGHDVTVFASRHNMFSKPLLQIEPVYKLIWCGYPIPGLCRIGVTGLLYKKRIMTEHAKKTFDILHCHPVMEPALYGIKVRKKTGIPVVATSCGGDLQKFPQYQYGYRLKPRRDKLVRKAVRNSDVIGSVSRSIRKHIEEIGTEAKIVDIPNGVNWDIFQIDKNPCYKEQLLELQKDTTVILTLGRNHPVKNFSGAIKSYSRIASKFPNSCYVIVGRNSSFLSPLVNELGLTNRIKLIEQVPMSEVPKYFRAADIFFNPSLIEGFSQVNAQALASGLPCVITDAPGNVDAGDYGGCLITKSNDLNSMSENLEKLLGSDKLRLKLAEEAFMAGKNYAWSAIARSYLELFKTTIGEKK